MNKDERNLEDILDTVEVKDWFFRAEREMFPNMKASASSICIPDSEPDAKLCLEMGAALMFDKPIIVLVRRGQKIPGNLRKCAAALIEADLDTPEGKQKGFEALRGALMALGLVP